MNQGQSDRVHSLTINTKADSQEGRETLRLEQRHESNLHKPAMANTAQVARICLPTERTIVLPETSETDTAYELGTSTIAKRKPRAEETPTGLEASVNQNRRECRERLGYPENLPNNNRHDHPSPPAAPWDQWGREHPPALRAGQTGWAYSTAWARSTFQTWGPGAQGTLGTVWNLACPVDRAPYSYSPVRTAKRGRFRFIQRGGAGQQNAAV